MANEVTLFNPSAIPDYLKDLNDVVTIPDRQTVNSLSYSGKQWTMSIDGKKYPLQREDEDNELVPATVVKFVIVNFNPRRGRAFYEGAYNPESVSPPACWSDDGEKPDPQVTDPKCATCAECPMAVKGSRVNELGVATTACTPHQMLVVVPAFKIKGYPAFRPPLRLKLAITSIWDSKSPELEAKNWRAFTQYWQHLKTGMDNIALVVTKMKFDPNEVYPKVIFSPERFLTEDEKDAVAPLVKSKEVLELMKMWTPDGVDGVKRDPVAAEAAESKTVDDTAAKEAEKAEKAAAAKKAKEEKAAAAKKAKAEKAAAADDDDDMVVVMDGEVEPPAAKPAAKPATEGNGVITDVEVAAAPAGTPELSPELDNLLKDWG